MSLILDALKRLEAKAPPPPTAVDPEPIVLESVAVSTPQLPPDDWFEQTEVVLSGLELTEQDVEVQISLAALEGDVLNLDLEVQREAIEAESPAVEAEVVEPIFEKPVITEPIVELVKEIAEEPSIAEVMNDVANEAVLDEEMVTDLDLPAGAATREPSLPKESLDFAAEIAKLWSADDEVAEQPVTLAEVTAPSGCEPAANEVAEPVPKQADESPDEREHVVSFGPLADDVFPINSDLPAGAGEEFVEDVADVEEATDDLAPSEVVESNVAQHDEPAETLATDESAADAEVPSGAILPIADFRPAVAELADPERDELVDDHDVLVAQLKELEFRGLRDNVLSQLPDAPAALLFAAADDETHVADVVLRLSQSLASLRQGEVAVVCSTRLYDAYLASTDFGELTDALPPKFHKPHRVPTVVIDAKDASDRMIADLKRRCRWVLFAADRATARRWSPLCEASYVVIGLGNSDRRTAVQTVLCLERSGGLVLGCVLTDVPEVA